jgi:hypothetical protein
MNDPSAGLRKQQERERQLQKLKQYRALWAESERVLDILRSESGTPMKPVTNEEITAWAETK